MIELRNKYYKNQIDKAEYIKKMYEGFYNNLFILSHGIKNTEIEKIEILENEVLLTNKDGLKLAIPQYDHRTAPLEAINFYSYESGDSKIIEESLRSSKVFVDVGANIGWYTLGAAAKYPDLQVYSFEPMPTTFGWLNKNKDLNDLNNVHLFNFGLSNEDDEIDFYYSPEGSGNASARNLTNKDDTIKITVNVKIMDKMEEFKSIKIDFMKIDVEGAELFALQGAIKLIERDRPVIFCEILRKWSKQFNYVPDDILIFLRDLGYECFEIIEDGILNRIKNIDENTVATNFLFKPCQNAR